MVRLFLSAVISFYGIILEIIDCECKDYNKDIMPKKPPVKVKPMTAKRKKILELAMMQLKKTREQMDPSVLDKIRSVIASNPKVMKGLGLDKMPEEEGGKLNIRSPHKNITKEKSVEARLKDTEEVVDQVHNQEVIAKLMQLKPSEVDNIKKVLLKDQR